MKRSLALHSAMIVDRTDEGAFHFVTLHAPGIAAQARPGQFIQVLPPHDPGEFFLPRPMSIMLAERKTGHVHFAFKEAGRGTRRLATTRRGDTLRVFGPLGRGWSTPASKQTLLLIGGGVGFPPLYFQAWKQSSERGNNNSPVFVVGARSAEELDYADRIRALGVDIRIATDDGSREFHGNAVGLMEEIVAERDDVDWRIQACGPMPMLAGVARVATGLGLDAEVSLETPMACGVGACMGCALPIEPTGTSTSKLTILCDQGPVYDAAEPDWAALEQQSRSASAPSRRVERAVVSTIFAGIEMANPVVLASGTFGYGAEYGRIIDLDRVGAVITKSVSENPRAGNPPPRIRELPTGMLNAIGLQNVGVDRFIEEKLPLFDGLSTRLIVNVVGHDEAEYLRVLDRLAGRSSIDGIELNLSCPNVKGGMRLASDPATIEYFVRRARERCDLPLIVKLTPNVTDVASVARAAEAGGADGISLINTLVGMAIDLDNRRPWVSRGTAGYSGPGVKPVALAMTWLVAQAVSIPVLGGGGISTAEDACEFLVAGASAVSVGTTTFVDPEASIRIAEGIGEWLSEQGCRSVTEVVGTLRSWPGMGEV